MRKLLLTTAVAALSSCSAAPAFAEWRPVDMNRTIDAVNFQVNEGCSGTLIDAKEGLILTANHCVTDQYETIEREKIDADGVIKKEKVRRLRDGSVTQYIFRGTESIQTVTYKVRLLATDRDNDLALLKAFAPLPAQHQAAIACSIPIRGETAYVVGNPYGVLYSSVVKGIVSSNQRDYRMLGISSGDDGDSAGKSGLMQISGGVVGGNSGGSVWNEDGEFVGVPVRGSRVNEVIAFAVPLDAVKDFLKAQKLEYLYAYCAQ